MADIKVNLKLNEKFTNDASINSVSLENLKVITRDIPSEYEAVE